MKASSIFIKILAGIFLAVPYALAYEVVEVQNGGVLKGVVEYAGKEVPADPAFVVTANTAYCGTSVPAERYLIKDRKIKNVVVFLENIRAGKPLPTNDVDIASKHCVFVPHVAVGFSGNYLKAMNDDPMLHLFDIHVFKTGKELHHFNIHEMGTSVTKKLFGAGLLEFSDYVHPWEHALLYVFDQPYVSVTDDNGVFVIDNIPAGSYTVQAWHEMLGIVNITNVKVEGGKSRAITIRYPSN